MKLEITEVTEIDEFGLSWFHMEITFSPELKSILKSYARRIDHTEFAHLLQEMKGETAIFYHSLNEFVAFCQEAAHWYQTKPTASRDVIRYTIDLGKEGLP